LIDELQHCPLDLIVTTSTIIEASTTNGVYFIEEDNASFLRPSHLEQFSDHSRTFTNIFLNQLGSNDANKGRVCPVCDGSSTERLAGSWWAKEEDTFRWIDTKVYESLGLWVLYEIKKWWREYTY
jgi:hypothetical protein